MSFARRRPLVFGLLALVAAASARPAAGHETDQFTLPPTDQLADLGPDFTRWYYEAIRDGVALANRRIDAAFDADRPPNETGELQKPTAVVNAVDQSCLRGNTIVDAVEAELRSDAMARRHPGQAIYFREDTDNIYKDAFSVFDTRILSRWWLGSTVKLFGHVIGTDKFGHFTAIGITYYWRYEQSIALGRTEAEATADAVATGTDGRWSEADLYGLTLTGDYANADLSANFAGLLFFRNLCEAVSVAGTVRPPLLVRDGRHWRLSPRCRPDGDWLRPFVSDHWNEALNPGWFTPDLRPTLRRHVAERTDTLLHWYAPGRSGADAQAYCRARRLDLETYWGVDYGHRGDDESLVAIDNTCFGPRP